MLEIEYEESWGDRVRLALCAERYEEGGGLAVLALDATDPDDEDGFLELWETLTVNLPESADAVAWCKRPGGVVLDASNLSRPLARALLAQGVVELSGDFVVSGFCSYPLATVTPRALGLMRGCEETARELSARRRP